MFFVDNTVVQKISYGLFVLTANKDGKDNGCIINTVTQVTVDPNQITIAVNKLNYTHDLIAETNPIVIIDEPQSVMGGKGEEAVEYLNPLCTLRYSATHKEIQNLIYKLDAVDAYEMDLVKGIEVASFESVDYHNKAYLKLISTTSDKNGIRAK